MVPPALAIPTSPVGVGAETAFVAVFGLFVVAFVVLAVVTMRWAVRRDKSGRDEWLARRRARPESTGETEPPSSNGGGSFRSRGRSSGAPG